MLVSLLALGALIFFALATCGIQSPPRFSWIAAGLFCWAAAQTGPMFIR